MAFASTVGRGSAKTPARFGLTMVSMLPRIALILADRFPVVAEPSFDRSDAHLIRRWPAITRVANQVLDT